jgi:hypothetical protein
VNPEWWEDVLAPLKQMELTAMNNSEDMELQTRALTEPLPTSQQVHPMQDLGKIKISLISCWPVCFWQNFVLVGFNNLCNYLGLQRPSSICS